MAMTKKEQVLVGATLVVGGLVGIGMLLVMPQVDAITLGWSNIEQQKKQLEQLNVQKSSLESHIAQYQQEKKIPTDIILRTYKPDNVAAVMKEMVGTIVSQATKNGTMLISLIPVDLNTPFGESNSGGSTPAPTAPTPVTPVASSAAAPATTEAPAANPVQAAANAVGSAVTGSSASTAPVAPQPLRPGLQTYGYDLVVRGNYQSIQGFLASLNKHKELIEVSNILIENEAGSERQDTDGIKSDLLRPIKLTTRLKLILLPDQPMAQTPGMPMALQTP
jgi:hypothetical protein